MNQTQFKEKVKEEFGLENKDPVQMNLPFERVYSALALKEAIRGVKAITREAVRFGSDRRAIGDVMDILAEVNPVVFAALDAIDESLMDD